MKPPNKLAKIVTADNTCAHGVCVRGKGRAVEGITNGEGGGLPCNNIFQQYHLLLYSLYMKTGTTSACDHSSFSVTVKVLPSLSGEGLGVGVGDGVEDDVKTAYTELKV